MSRSSVLLPDPFGPTTTATPPDGTSNETSSRTGSGAPAIEKDRETWSSLMVAKSALESLPADAFNRRGRDRMGMVGRAGAG